jgi:hypothetical protein
MPRWSYDEEDILVENLELGYDLVTIAMIVGRTPQSVAMKIVHLAMQGRLIIMAPETFDELFDGSSQ